MEVRVCTMHITPTMNLSACYFVLLQTEHSLRRSPTVTASIHTPSNPIRRCIFHGLSHCIILLFYSNKNSRTFIQINPEIIILTWLTYKDDNISFRNPMLTVKVNTHTHVYLRLVTSGVVYQIKSCLVVLMLA